MATAAPSAPPARWLIFVAVATALYFTVLRLWLAATLDLRFDEAYYWTWSKQWVAGYLDQPPMVAWFVRFGTTLLGDTPLGVRLAQILALPLIEFFLADIVRRRTGSWNAALFVVIALECTIYFSLVVVVVEPSVPLLLGTSALLWSLCRLDQSMDGRWWLAAGVAGGFAFLSKLVVVLLAPALLVFLLSRRHRGWLASPWPWLALILALAMCAPCLIWNAQHGWPTFIFQSGRLDLSAPLSTRELVKFVVFDFLCGGLLLMPLAVVQGVRLAARSVATRQPYELLIAVAFLVPLAFFLVRSLSALVLQTWMYFAWPIGVVGVALMLQWSGRWTGAKVALAAIALPGAVLTSLLFYHGIWDSGVWLGTGDPFGQDAGYADMSERILADARINGAQWIATTDYKTYANLSWHIGEDIPIVQVNQRGRFIDLAIPDPARLTGRALYVHQLAAPASMDAASRTLLETVPIVWRGLTMSSVDVEILDGYTPTLVFDGDWSRATPTAPDW